MEDIQEVFRRREEGIIESKIYLRGIPMRKNKRKWKKARRS